MSKTIFYRKFECDVCGEYSKCTIEVSDIGNYPTRPRVCVYQTDDSDFKLIESKEIEVK